MLIGITCKLFEISANGEFETEITVTVNKESFVFWILQYGQHVEVLEPKEYRDNVADIVMAIANKYRKSEEESQ